MTSLRSQRQIELPFPVTQLLAPLQAGNPVAAEAALRGLSHERLSWIALLFSVANWRESAGVPQRGIPQLMSLYRLFEPLELRRTSYDTMASALRLCGQLRSMFRRFRADPVRFRQRRPAAVNEALKQVRVIGHPFTHPRSGELVEARTFEFPTDEAIVAFCHASLADPRFHPEWLRVCRRPACSRFFWRHGKRIYCTDTCTELADRGHAVKRQQNFRRKHK